MQTNATAGRSGEQPGILQVQWFFRIAIAVCALVDCWICRFSMNADGVSYLDMGDLYWKGDWHAALNTYWSPLYSWLTGLLFWVTRPAMRWEYPAVHLLNFAILMAALLCFEFFWRELLATREDGGWSGLPLRHAWILGYLLFACVHFEADELAIVTPDVIVAALVYLASGMMLRFTAGRLQAASALALGIVLGVGYLAKAAMFPFAIVLLITMLAVTLKRHGRKRLFGFTLIGFLAVSLPFVAALSLHEHRLTWGDAATMNQGWYVNHVTPRVRHWQGDGPGHANPLHPSRKLLAWPEVYEFGTPTAVTYPISLNVAYWYAGIDSSFHLLREIKVFSVNLRLQGNYVFKVFGILTAVLLMMFLSAGQVKESCRRLLKFWPVLVPVVAVLLMYAMVYWEQRFTVAIVVVICGAIAASSFEKVDEKWSLERLCAANIVLAGLLIGWILPVLVLTYSYHDGVLAAQQVPITGQLQIMGLKPDNRVALIGDGFEESYWARLGKFRIVAEVPHTLETGDSATAFWNSNPEGQQIVLNTLKSTGAKAVIAIKPPAVLPMGWVKIGNTDHAVYFFR